MKKILNKTFIYSLFLFILLIVLTSVFLYQYNIKLYPFDAIYPEIIGYNSYKFKKLKGKKLYFDKYSRKNILNAKNLYTKALKVPEKLFFDSEKRIDSIGFIEKIYNLFWSINYIPGEISNVHYGLKNRCTVCHSLFNISYKEKCLACHRALAEKMNTGIGFHYNKRNESCIQCHLEHLGNDINFVDLSSFRHVYTEYPLIGYHKKADCYYCHQKAQTVKPNTIISENTISRSWLRFSLKKFTKCNSCHPDPHKPTFGKNCKPCHPLKLHWHQ